MAKKKLNQPELPCKPMQETELPGMPEKPPVPALKPASIEELVLVGNAAKICSKDVRALEIFIQVLSKHYSKDARAASILTFLPVGEKSLSVTLTNLPKVDRSEEFPPIHKFAYDCIAEYTSNKRFKGPVACN
jgi:hypothetical protein